METQNEIELLKRAAFSTDWEKVEVSMEKLGEIGVPIVFDFLLTLLDLDNKYSRLRNLAANKVLDIGDNRAVDPLVKAALKKDNIGHSGSFVHALTYLNCKNRLKEIFQILLYSG